MLMSFVAEPLLTGLGAGGHLLVAGGGWEPRLLDFFVEAPCGPATAQPPSCGAIDVSFGDAAQVFYIGPASCGLYGTPAGVCGAMARWGTMPLGGARRARGELARAGVALNAEQAYVAQILAELLLSTPECAALWAPSRPRPARGRAAARPRARGGARTARQRGGGAVLRAATSRPRSVRWLGARGGSLTGEALAAYRASSSGTR